MQKNYLFLVGKSIPEVSGLFSMPKSMHIAQTLWIIVITASLSIVNPRVDKMVNT